MALVCLTCLAKHGGSSPKMLLIHTASSARSCVPPAFQSCR